MLASNKVLRSLAIVGPIGTNDILAMHPSDPTEHYLETTNLGINLDILTSSHFGANVNQFAKAVLNFERMIHSNWQEIIRQDLAFRMSPRLADSP